VKRARTVMLQGTSSGVGKSLLAAALCRVLRRRGMSVLPFKAQNMSLNVAVTADGGEVARAQALQAVACGVDVTTDMNPILIKPDGEHSAQVVVDGSVVGRMTAHDFHQLKPRLWHSVAGAIDRLRAQCDVLVVEGAGSPAEVNLRDRDIVNMRVAEYAGAPVLLVAGIDRGGVFASLLGTLDLLRAGERRMVRGLLVNNFRGDRAAFAEGIAFLQQRSRLPVIGPVPHVNGLRLAEEDALGLPSLRSGGHRDKAALDVAVLSLPRMSNFDDCDPLHRERGVGVRMVDSGDRLGDPDLVVLPGSKTTLADLDVLRERGVDRALRAARDRGTAVLGICGGMQLLGRVLSDPDGVDGERRGRGRGLGLLPTSTRMGQAKVVRRVSGEVLDVPGLFAAARGLAVSGYEVHVGSTPAAAPPLRLRDAGGDAWEDGATSEDGWVAGTHVHGLFEETALRRALLRAVAEHRGRRWRPGSVVPDTESELDRLADALESSVDMHRVLAIIDAGAP
jgi:adenosylcobyric acid synthase